MNAVRLDCVGRVDQVFVDHGHERCVMFLGKGAKDLCELLDVVAAVVGWQGDAGKQDFDVRIFQRGEHQIEVAACLVERQAAQSIVAAELDNDDLGMHQQDGMDASHGVLCGGPADAFVYDLVVVAAGVQVPLQRVGVGLPVLEAIARGDAVAIADEDVLPCG